MHTQLSCIRPTSICRHFAQVFVNQRWPCRAKNRSQHWENSRLDHSRFRHMPCSPVDYFMLLWFRFVQKELFKILFKSKIEKFDDKVHQSWLLKRRPLSVQSATLYCAVLWAMCFSWTHFKLTVPPLQKSSIHIMNTVQKKIECWIQQWTILMTFSE